MHSSFVLIEFFCEFATLVTVVCLNGSVASDCLLSLIMNQKSVFISLANEIISRCTYDNVIVPLDFCIYLIELKLLQLSRDISFVNHDAELAETLVKNCVNDLKNDSISLKTLKLQLFWRKKYQSRDVIKKVHHERIFKNVLLLMSEITENILIKTGDKDLLFKKIAIFIIMFAGLGSPTQPSIIKETLAALHSIFRNTEVENFLTLPRATKEQQLIEFARLITGILLFNKDCKKGGEGMDDLPLILTQGVSATKERLFSFKDQLNQRIDHFVKFLLQKCMKKGDYIESESRAYHPSEHKKENLEEFKSLLIYFRQVEYCLNDLIKDLEKSFIIIQELVERLQSTLLQVHNVVRYRVAVSTLQVFPLFLQLSNVWVEMQEEIDILSEINNNFVDLSLNAKTQLTLPVPSEFDLSNKISLPPESGEIQESSNFYPGVKICSVSTSMQEQLQYKGFCAWALSHAEGLLITGNTKVGVIYFLNRVFTFSSAEAAYKWALNPNHYIKTVLNVARFRPEIIKLLNLEDDLSEKLTVEEDQKPAVANSQVQTDLHPLESFISKDYTFSEWELKRRVLKLANLTKYVTKSQQTTKQSCFRTDMNVQVTPCKDISTQTTKDGYCNHPPVPKSAWTYKLL